MAVPATRAGAAVSACGLAWRSIHGLSNTDDRASLRSLFGELERAAVAGRLSSPPAPRQ